MIRKYEEIKNEYQCNENYFFIKPTASEILLLNFVVINMSESLQIL